MPVINMGIGDDMYQFPHLHAAHLGDHVQQHRILHHVPVVGRKNVLGSLVQDRVQLAAAYVDPEKEINTPEDAILGAKDIIAELISDDAETRKALREFLFNEGLIVSVFSDKQEDKEKLNTYEMYKEFSEKISTLPSHRILALNRGEKEECLKVSISASAEPKIFSIGI